MKSKQKDIRILKNALRNQNLSKQEYIRVQAVLLKKKRYSLKQISDISNKKLVTIQGWITCYNQNGIEGLKTKEKETPSHYTLTKEQKDHIKKLIAEHKPKDYGLSSDFWSASTLKQLVKDKFKVEYKTVKSYRELLKYCGFSYQKAEYIDRRKNSGQTEHFKKHFEKKVKKGVISMWW